MNEKAFPLREKLLSPNDAARVLLHSCCAPCACEIMEGLKESGIEQTVYYYNPNIFPREEYELRKNENKRFADKLDVPFIDADWENEAWLARVKGFEDEPERGKRCSQCFFMRLERAARYAFENGFPVLATSLGISRHKDQVQVYDAGRVAAALFKDLVFWDFNWRKGGGVERGAAITKHENFYRQNYCGCVFSRRRVDNR